jgi:hypothetical protein
LIPKARQVSIESFKCRRYMTAYVCMVPDCSLGGELGHFSPICPNRGPLPPQISPELSRGPCKYRLGKLSLPLSWQGALRSFARRACSCPPFLVPHRSVHAWTACKVQRHGMALGSRRASQWPSSGLRARMHDACGASSCSWERGNWTGVVCSPTDVVPCVS